MEDKVHPDLKPYFLQMPKNRTEHEDIQTRREFLKMQAEKNISLHPNVSISEHYINGPSGAPDVRVKIYQPATKEQNLPCLLWIHGGGFLYGSPEQDENLCQRFVTEAHCVVVSVDYRLAPEHPFPVGLEDCYATLIWLSEHNPELGVDVSRIAVAGVSCGGGLAAALTLLSRDRKGPKIHFQMPLYPMIDDRNITPSSHEIDDQRVWNRELNIRSWKLYLGENAEDVSEYAAPSRASDLSGLPPAYTFIGTLDTFRDEAIDYVKRLCEFGVPTEFHLYPGCFHGFESMFSDAEVSKRAVSQCIDVLKRAFKKQ